MEHEDLWVSGFGFYLILFKVPYHLRPRKWSNKSQTGALRVPITASPKPDSIPRVDPFADYTAAYLKHKTAQGRDLRQRRRDSDRWKRHQLKLEKERTEVTSCKDRYFLPMGTI